MLCKSWVFFSFFHDLLQSSMTKVANVHLVINPFLHWREGDMQQMTCPMWSRCTLNPTSKRLWLWFFQCTFSLKLNLWHWKVGMVISISDLPLTVCSLVRLSCLIDSLRTETSWDKKCYHRADWTCLLLKITMFLCKTKVGHAYGLTHKCTGTQTISSVCHPDIILWCLLLTYT